MKYIHKATGYKVDTNELKGQLCKGVNHIRFKDPNYKDTFGGVTEFDSIREPMGYYTYSIVEIPFSSDWTEVESGVNLSMEELECVMWFLRFNAPQDDQLLASSVSKLHKAHSQLVDTYIKGGN